MLNTHDDGISLDTFVDWLVASGQQIERIDDYDQWLDRFEAAMKSLPDDQRKNSVLPLLERLRPPGGTAARRTDARRKVPRGSAFGEDRRERATCRT